MKYLHLIVVSIILAAITLECEQSDILTQDDDGLPADDRFETTTEEDSSMYEVAADRKGRFINLLLWPLKRVWRAFVLRQVVPALLGAKMAVLWPTLLVLVGLLESALAGLLFFYFLFSSAVSLPAAANHAPAKIDVLNPLRVQPPAMQYWWYEPPTAEPYKTISQEDIELMEAMQNENESTANSVEEKSDDRWTFKTSDNPQVTYYPAYTHRMNQQH